MTVKSSEPLPQINTGLLQQKKKVGGANGETISFTMLGLHFEDFESN